MGNRRKQKYGTLPKFSAGGLGSFLRPIKLYVTRKTVCTENLSFPEYKASLYVFCFPHLLWDKLGALLAMLEAKKGFNKYELRLINKTTFLLI